MDSNQKRDKLLLYLPLILVELYLIFTLLLFQFGPLNWDTQNVELFWIYIFLYHIAFIAGYICMMYIYKINTESIAIANTVQFYILKYMWLILGICVVMSFVKYRNTTFSNNILPLNLLDEFVKGLKNPGSQYYLKFGRSSDYISSKLVTVISAIFSIFTNSIIPICVLLWDKIKFSQKLTFFFIILFELATWVSIGTNKGIFDLLFLFATSLILTIIINFKDNKLKIISERSSLLIFTIFILIFSLWFFAYGMTTRVGSMTEAIKTEQGVQIVEGNNEAEPEVTTPEVTEPEVTEPEVTEPEVTEPEVTEPEVTEPEVTEPEVVTPEVTQPETTIPEENTIVKVPKKGISLQVENLFYGLSTYLAQGYYGFSLALDEPFNFTYGVGNSRFLSSNVESIFGIQIESRTYQAKINSEWSQYGKWHTFYSYMANDFHFIGVIFVMFIIGGLCAITWKTAYYCKDIIAFLLLPIYVILFLYIPANNQVFGNLQTCVAFFQATMLFMILRVYSKSQSVKRRI